MTRKDAVLRHLKRGKVYRRSDLEHLSSAVDRHLSMLVKEGSLQKVAAGIYLFPKKSVFGMVPARQEDLVRSFLKDDRFLITSANMYNSLGVGTTQLYNKQVVYNHKRHGEFKLGDTDFTFIRKPHFPKQATPEFLMVDLVNNVDTLAEDKTMVLSNVAQKARQMDPKKLERAVMEYGSLKTRKMFHDGDWISKQPK